MKIGIFSDTHLGFDRKGQRNNESFENLEQALNLCLGENVDFCVLAGDIFDEPVPSHTSLFKSINSFRLAQRNNL